MVYFTFLNVSKRKLKFYKTLIFFSIFYKHFVYQAILISHKLSQTSSSIISKTKKKFIQNNIFFD